MRTHLDSTEGNQTVNQPSNTLFKLLKAGLITAIVVPAALIGFAIWSHDSSPVDLGDVYQVSRADSMHEVEQLIGQPDRTRMQGGSGEVSWTYSDPLKWHEFRVDFAQDGKVVRCVFQD